MIPVRRLLLPSITVTAGLVVVLVLGALRTELALGIWLLVLAMALLLELARDVRTDDADDRSRRFDEALRGRRAGNALPAELVRMDRELALGIGNADHAHRRLLPLLRAAAAARLSSRHGIELGRSPDAARALLGDRTWELLRPDRPAPEDRHGRGVPRADVAAAIEAVESL